MRVVARLHKATAGPASRLAPGELGSTTVSSNVPDATDATEQQTQQTQQGDTVGGALIRVVVLCAVTTIGAVSAARVSGRIAILEKDNKPTPDLGDAVVYLEGAGTPATAATPITLDIAITDKVRSE